MGQQFSSPNARGDRCPPCLPCLESVQIHAGCVSSRPRPPGAPHMCSDHVSFLLRAGHAASCCQVAGLNRPTGNPGQPSTPLPPMHTSGFPYLPSGHQHCPSLYISGASPPGFLHAYACVLTVISSHAPDSPAGPERAAVVSGHGSDAQRGGILAWGTYPAILLILWPPQDRTGLLSYGMCLVLQSFPILEVPVPILSVPIPIPKSLVPIPAVPNPIPQVVFMVS